MNEGCVLMEEVWFEMLKELKIDDIKKIFVSVVFWGVLKMKNGCGCDFWGFEFLEWFFGMFLVLMFVLRNYEFFFF